MNVSETQTFDSFQGETQQNRVSDGRSMLTPGLALRHRRQANGCGFKLHEITFSRFNNPRRVLNRSKVLEIHYVYSSR